MSAALLRKVRTCRGCGATSDTVRFRPLAGVRCARCQDLQAAARAARVACLRPAADRGATPLRPRPGENGAHLAWIRSLPCRVGSRACGSITHAHHVRVGTGGGTGLKPPDRWAVPLCPRHHGEGHQTGWSTFEARYGLDLRAIAEGLAAASPFLQPGDR